MQSLNNKMKKVNLFLLRKERKLFFILSFIVLFLIFSYAFLIFSSVSIAYSLEQGEEKLVKINSDNSVLESKFSVTKEDVWENFESRLVLSRNVEYVDSSFEKLVFNK